MIAAYWDDLDHEGERTQLGLGPGRVKVGAKAIISAES